MVSGYYIQKAKIKPNSVVVYNHWNGSKSLNMQNANLMDNFKGKKNDGEDPCEEKFIGSKTTYIPNRETRRRYCGQMTKGSRKRMVEAVQLFSSVINERFVYNKYLKKKIKHTFSFITLTIPEQNRRVSGKEGYNKLLRPFIEWLLENKVNTYIWKAELQNPLDFQGRLKVCKGQLHYHVIIPNWIDKRAIRDRWNKLLMSRGLSAGHADAPSTSIEKPYKVKDVAAYIVKEICKNTVSTKSIKTLETNIKEAEKSNATGCVRILKEELERVIELQELEDTDLGGKIWGCSLNLKPKKKLIEVYDKKVNLEEIDTLIKETKKNIEHIQNDNILLNRSQSFFAKKIEFLLNEKRLLYFLKKERLRFYKKEKNYFEVEFTPQLYERLNLVYSFMEDTCNWNKNKNIFENDYVTIYNLPSYYWEIMLDKRHTNEKREYVRYLDEYTNWKKERVGEVSINDFVKNPIFEVALLLNNTNLVY